MAGAGPLHPGPEPASVGSTPAAQAPAHTAETVRCPDPPTPPDWMTGEEAWAWQVGWAAGWRSRQPLEAALAALLDTMERGDEHLMQERMVAAGRLLGLARYDTWQARYLPLPAATNPIPNDPDG